MGMVIRCNLHLQWGSHTQPVPGSWSASCHAPAAERESLEKRTVTMQTDRETDRQTDRHYTGGADCRPPAAREAYL